MFIVAFKAMRKHLIINAVASKIDLSSNPATIPNISSRKLKFTKFLKFAGVFINYAFMLAVLFFCFQGFVWFALNLHQVELQRNNILRTTNSPNTTRNQDGELKPIATDKHKGIHVIPADQITTKFTEVAGLNEAKDEVQDIISFLQDPESFSRLGAKSPKGVLLYGEPGTGKTLLARAISGEAKVNFIAVSGSEFDEEYVGVGASRVRHLFETARENAPCIVFIDEIDALAHKRHAHDPAWSAQTVNQLLAEMDGLDNTKNQGIVVIGASNRIDAMDPAMLRPGRLDRHIKLDVPTLSERIDVLKLYLAKVTVAANVNPEKIAKMTPAFSSAELANLVNEATIIATKQKRDSVEMQDFDAAKDRVILGSKRAAMKVTAKERKITAYHEAGHALVGHLLGAQHNPIYKVTITPRGPSLGHTSFEPSDEEHSISLSQIENMIAMQLAGRIAEEIMFGEQNITTGAESDLQQATKLAYNMVTRWGYSKRVGLVHQDKAVEFIPKDVIEQEVQLIMQRNYERAKQVVTQNRVKLDKLANGLLENETLDAKEVKALLK